MKHRINLPKTFEGTVEVDVEFPIYRKHDLLLDEMDAVTFVRIEAPNHYGHHRKVSVTRRSMLMISSAFEKPHSFELSVEVDFRFDGRSEVDYNLGLGEYACTAEEFDDVMTEARTFASIISLLEKP